jgi:chromosome segregation ATPase
LHRLREALHDSERAVASLRQELEAVTRERVTAKEELEAHRQKAITENEARIAEEARLRESLSASEKNLAALGLAFEDAKSQVGSTEGRLKEHWAASEQAIASLKRDLDAVRENAVAEFNERLAASEKAVATLKQEHASAITKAAADHQEKIAQKDTFIEELKAKLQGFAKIEKSILPAAAGQVSSSNRPGEQGVTNRRSFGVMAMAIVAALSTGAGGVGAYVYRGDGDGPRRDDQATIKGLQGKLAEQDKLNHDLEDGLRSQHDAYERVNEDLKRAEDQLRTQMGANPGAGANDDLQRQLTDERAVNQQLQQKLTALETELVQRKQDIATRDQTIDQLNRQLQEAKSQEAKAHATKEIRPKPRQTIDFDTTIRNLEREYGIPRIGR